MMRTTNKLHN